MRFCLRHSLKLQEVIEASKAALVDVAQEEMLRTKQDTSDSRLSIMTGVHRPDVKRLVTDPEHIAPTENSVARLIGQWQGDQRFCSARGVPKILKLDGKRSEFADLVESVSSALNPYTVLFELERIGAVERTPQGLKLIARAYIKSDDLEQAFRFLSRDCDDMISAVEENVMGRAVDKNLHLQTEYDQVGVSYLPQIRRWFLAEGSAFHARARAFLAKFDKDLNPKVNRYEPTARVAVCSFSRVAEPVLTDKDVNSRAKKE